MKTLQNIVIQAEQSTVDASVGEGKRPKFDVVAYNGGPLTVGGYDLPIVLDLSGLEQGKSVIANLHHKKDHLVGHVGTVENNGKTLRLSGEVSAVSQSATEFVDSAKNGFPWQASIEAKPLKVEEIPEGRTVMVNGQSIQGPVYVARKSRLYGVAFLPHGADENTTVQLAASAVEFSHVKGANMPFDKWVEAMGFDAESLTDVQRERLQAKFQEEITASASEEKVVEATDFDVGDIKAAAAEHLNDLEASFAEYEGEVPAAKFAEIKATALKQHREMKAKAIRERWNAPKFEVESVRAVSGVKLDLVRAGASHEGPAIHVSKRDEMSPTVIEAALALTMGMPNVEKHYKAEALEAADKNYKNIGIQQVLLMAASANGMPISAGQRVHTGNLRQVLKRALPDVEANSFSTLGVSVSNILSNVATKELVAGYEEQDNTWREVSTIKTVRDFKKVTTYRLLDNMEYEPLGPGGEIKHGSVSQESYERQAKTYAKMFALTREDIINDDLGAFDDLRTRLGAGAAMKMRDIFWSTFLDNGSFFTSGRGNFISGATTNLGLDGVGLGLGIKAFRTMKSAEADGAKRIGGEPVILLVPPELEAIAQQLYTSSNLTGGSSPTPNANIYVNKYRPVIVSQLSESGFTGNSATAWYLFRATSVYAAMVVSFLNGQQSPVVESADADFNTLGIQFRGYHDFGVDKAEYVAGVKSKGAA
jgi:hypothetical protein